MNIKENFEKLGLKKSQKMIYEPHDIFYLKFETNKRIALGFRNVDINNNETKKFRGFFTKTIKEKKEFYIQTDGNPAEREIFFHMCEFILIEIQKLKNLDSKDINDAIKGWVNFGKTNQNNLKENIQIGLFGELLFLKFLFEYFDERSVLICWHGPERKKVDFVLSNNLAVEIKAISDPLNSNINISSIQQLSNGYKEHFLRVYKLVITPQGKKLNQLFDELSELFTGNEKDVFIGKCCDYGYNYIVNYDNLKPISYIGYNDYCVNDKSFPKLTGEFDPRIIDIRYKISLENKIPFDSNYLGEELYKLSKS